MSYGGVIIVLRKNNGALVCPHSLFIPLEKNGGMFSLLSRSVWPDVLDDFQVVCVLFMLVTEVIVVM